MSDEELPPTPAPTRRMNRSRRNKKRSHGAAETQDLEDSQFLDKLIKKKQNLLDEYKLTSSLNEKIDVPDTDDFWLQKPIGSSSMAALENDGVEPNELLDVKSAKKTPTRATKRKKNPKPVSKPTGRKKRKTEIVADEVPEENESGDQSSLALFDVLKIDANDTDAENDHDHDHSHDHDHDDEDVFKIPSPVKKRRTRKRKTEQTNDSNVTKSKDSKQKKPVDKPRNVILNDVSQNDLAISRNAIAKDQDATNHDSASGPTDIKANKRLQRQQQKEQKENQRLLTRENKEKERILAKALEKEQRLQKERELEEKRNLLEEKRNNAMNRQNKMMMLHSLKDTTSKVISSSTKIPLKDESTKASNLVNLRRSSLSSRGKRLSSVGNGFTATPHEGIPNNELFKHVDISLPDSFKLKQLIIWLIKRFVKEEGQNVTIDRFLKDLIDGRVNVDWWGNDIDDDSDLKTDNKPIKIHKNRENVENMKKLEFYKGEVKKLERESKNWIEIKDNHINEFTKIHSHMSDSEFKIKPNDYDSRVDEEIRRNLEVAETRMQKFDNLLHILDSSNDLVKKLINEKNQVIIDSIGKECDIDSIKYLKALSKLKGV